MPMIPEVAVAMLACARIGAVHNVVFGGFSVDRSGSGWSSREAKALITVDGARRKGKTAPIKQQVDQVMGELETLEHIIVVRPGDRCEMKQGRDVWYDEIIAARRPECPAEPMDAEDRCTCCIRGGRPRSRRGSCTRPAALTGRQRAPPVRVRPATRRRVYWCSADVGWVTGHSYIVYGPLCNGATSVMYEGAPDYRTGGSGGSRRALQGHDLLHRADSDPRLHKVGREHPTIRTRARCGCWGRSVSRSTRRRGSGTRRPSGASAA